LRRWPLSWRVATVLMVTVGVQLLLGRSIADAVGFALTITVVSLLLRWLFGWSGRGDPREAPDRLRARPRVENNSKPPTEHRRSSYRAGLNELRDRVAPLRRL